MKRPEPYYHGIGLKIPVDGGSGRPHTQSNRPRPMWWRGPF